MVSDLAASVSASDRSALQWTLPNGTLMARRDQVGSHRQPLLSSQVIVSPSPATPVIP
jgi:hypothetical protein